jgi:hypothetical protein
MSTIVDEERETKKRAAEKFEKERPRLEFGGAWEYAPAPESKDHLRLEKKQGLFIGGKFVAPKSRKYFETINPAEEVPAGSPGRDCGRGRGRHRGRGGDRSAGRS